MKEKRTQVLSYGGGIQTAAMVAAIVAGKLEKPDVIVFADTGREKQSTWDYMEEIIKPQLDKIGLELEIAGHDLSKVDLYAYNGDLLIPVFTKTGKFPTFCSDEWKQRVVMRYLRSKGVKKCQVWLGFSTDEAKRAKPFNRKWFERRFPLLELGMSREDCISLLREMKWPIPLRSACYMCPNMADKDWIEMKRMYPSDFQRAIELEKEIQEWDEEVYLHISRKPIEEVEFDDSKVELDATGRICAEGFCWL